MIIYGTVGLFRKWIPLSSGMLAFVRGLIGGVFLLILSLFQKRSLSLGIGKARTALLMLSGVTLGINWILLFEAYNHTTVATATLCYYMQPTILILLSPLLFKERLTLRKGLCALISVGGMVAVSGVLSGTPVGADDLMGMVFGLGAAVLYAVTVILNKKNPVDNVYGKTIVQLFSSTVVLIPYVLLTDSGISSPLSGTALVMIAVVGIVHTGMAYALYFGSLKGLSSQSVAVLGYIDPVVALVLSAVLLREAMTLLQLVGAGLILVSALVSELPAKTKGCDEDVTV